MIEKHLPVLLCRKCCNCSSININIKYSLQLQSKKLKEKNEDNSQVERHQGYPFIH